MMETNLLFSSNSAAFGSGQALGQIVGQAFLWLLFFALAAKYFSMARRPATNARCALSLAIFFSSLLLIGMAVAAKKLSPTLSIPLALCVLAGFAGTIASLVLAIIGLVEYGSQPGRYTQGRAQAIWTLCLAFPFLCLFGLGVLVGFQRGRLNLLATKTNQPEAGRWMAFGDLNFKPRAPGKPWMQMDAKKLNKNASVVFRQSLPEVYFMVIAEKAQLKSANSLETVVELAKANLRSRMDATRILKETPLRRQGLDGELVESAVQSQSLHMFYCSWVCVTNGYIYQLVSWGNIEDAEKVRQRSEPLYDSFTLIDYHRHASKPGLETRDFHSDLFGYTVKMSGSGWRPSSVMRKNIPAAEFTGWDEQESEGLFVIPISLMGLDPADEALTQALAAIPGAAYPGADIRDEKSVVQRDLSGVEFGFDRTSTEGGNLVYRVRALKGAQCAYLIGAYYLAQSKDESKSLEEALNRVDFPEQIAPPSKLASQFNARDKRRHALVFDGLGLFYFHARQYEKSVDYFRTAFEFDRTSAVYLNNIANAYRNAGRHQEALNYLQDNPAMLATNKSVRANEAYLESQLQQVDTALTNFAALFAGGFRNDDYFVAYITLLLQAHQQDTALATVEDYLKENDSAAVRLLEARLYKQKKNFTKAIEMLKAQGRKYPYNAELSISLVDAYNQAGLYAEAVSLCQQLIDAQSDTAEAYYFKGAGEFGLKRYREAKTSFEAALKLSPANAGAKSYLDLVSGMLGQGNNSSVKEPIAPVPIPEKLRDTPAPEASSSYTKDYGAQYLKEITAISFVKKKEFKRTEYFAIKVLDASGIAACSSMQFGFDPLSEGIFVNDLEVKDEEGKVVSTGQVDDYYVVDAASTSQASQKKVLNIPISGLRPGCKIELTVTLQDLAPPEEFPFTAHACITAFPILEDILFIRGETNTLKFAGLEAENGSHGEDGIYWVRRQPEVYKWEPMEPSPADFMPMLCVGDATATWDGETRNYLEKLGNFLQLDDAGRELAGRLAKNASSESEKISLLARYVQTNYSYKALEFGRRARLPHKTAEIVHNQYGDCKDHALLLQQLLEASGIPARLALVNAQGKVRKELPSLDQFDHMIVYVPNFQNGFFIDCTDKGSDLSQSPPRGLAGKEALILDAAQPRFVAIPEYVAGSSSIHSRREVHVTNGPDVVVHEVLSLKGCNGSALRAYFKELQPSARRRFVDSQVSRQSGETTGFELRNLEDTQAPLVLELDYILKRQFHLTGNQLVGKLPDVWEQLYASADPVDNRTTPFELSFPIEVESIIALATPDGYRAPALEDFHQNVPMNFASSQSQAQKDGQGLKIDYRLQRRSGQFKPAEYGPYRDNMVKALNPLEQTVAFAKKP